MKLRTLLFLGLSMVMPAGLRAQSVADTSPAPAVQAPRRPVAARAARAVTLPALPATPVMSEAEQPVPPVAAAPPPPAVAPRPSAPGVAPAPPSPPKPVGQMLNVQIEVTLTDSKAAPKTVVLTVADGEMGQNRTVSYVGEARNSSYSFNADGRPTVTGSKIRLYLSAEATVPPALDASGKVLPSSQQISLRQSQTLILNDGDSVEIARAADPVSDRVFTLSVKVKIQR